jgi:hypothetical protein
VHIGPDEVDALAHIPAELRFPAPGLPAGNVLMGYDEQGRCPMLVEDRCSIYEHRPRTCRTYDCRVFTAAGLAPDDPSGPIAERVRRWRFTFPGARDEVEREAVRAAAAFVQRGGDDGTHAVPPTATGRAVLAVRMSADFIGTDEPGA